MLPRSLFPLIFIFVIDLIFKSFKDKKKIEENKKKRRQALNKDVKEKRDIFMPHKKDWRTILIGPMDDEKEERTGDRPEIVKEESKPKVDERPNRTEPLYNEFAFIDDSKPVESTEIKMKAEEKERGISKKRIRNNVLRGIIYSEILSEPKSVRYKKGM